MQGCTGVHPKNLKSLFCGCSGEHPYNIAIGIKITPATRCCGSRCYAVITAPSYFIRYCDEMDSQSWTRWMVSANMRATEMMVTFLQPLV